MVLVTDTATARRLNEACGFWCIRVMHPDETGGVYLTAELSPVHGRGLCREELWLVADLPESAQHWVQMRCSESAYHGGGHLDPRYGEFGPGRTWIQLTSTHTGWQDYRGTGWHEMPPAFKLVEAKWPAVPDCVDWLSCNDVRVYREVAHKRPVTIRHRATARRSCPVGLS